MDEANQIDRTKIEQNGWQQGAVCRLSTLNPSQNASHMVSSVSQSEEVMAILVSQDCDIVNDDLTKEPVAEWLLATPLEKPDNLCLHGRNSRKYHFEHNGIFYHAATRIDQTGRGMAVKTLYPPGIPRCFQ